jgi:hypothetical protein
MRRMLFVLAAAAHGGGLCFEAGAGGVIPAGGALAGGDGADDSAGVLGGP